MASLQELQAALIAADKAGATEDARALAQAIHAMQTAPASQPDLMAAAAARVDKQFQQPSSAEPPRAEIPVDPNIRAPAAVQPVQQGAPASMADQIVGAGETALALGTGAVGGSIGAAAGLGAGLAKSILNGQFGTKEAADMVERSVAEGAGALTYQPRTPAGQQQAQAVGGVLQEAVPMLGLGGQIGQMASMARPAAAAASETAQSAASRAVRASLGAPENPGATAPAGSVGAAGIPQSAVRESAAASLPVPVKLTKGQASRDGEQVRFERETAKAPEGKALVERFAQQNEDLPKNFDVWVDEVGSQGLNAYARGEKVDAALNNAAKRDRAQIRSAYEKAEKAGELDTPVELDGLVKHLNDSAPDAAVAPLLNTARGHALKLGIAVEGEGGQLMPQAVSLKTAELYRQAINRATDFEPTNVRQAAIMKGLLDGATDGMGGDLYKQARSMRMNYAHTYENRSIVKKLMNTRRGTDDRMVAFENVFDHAVLRGSADDIKHLRNVLMNSGDDGKQAWKELQGSTLHYLKEKALENSATDSRGNVIMSAAKLDRAVRELEAGGKLDFVLGKKGAEGVRDLNDIAKVVFTTPPGTVNTSNTASVVIQALVESGITSGIVGLPLPLISALKGLARHSKNKRMQARIQDALNNAQRKTRIQLPHDRTMH